MKKVIASIYLVVGLITAILDSIKVIKISYIEYQAYSCASNGNVVCMREGITNMLLFLVNIIFGPVLLAARIATNPTLGIYGGIIAFIILLIAYGRRK